MDGRDLARRQRAGQRAFYAHVIAGARGARVEDLGGGVQAAVSPGAPDRSIMNAVLYEDRGEVARRIEELAELYAAAGVRAWTVWVQPGDEALAELLALAGHAFDGQTTQMGAALDELDLDGDDDLDLLHDPTWRLVGEINDDAYRLPGDLAELLAPCADDACRLWIARLDGHPAGCVVVRASGGDAYVALVATRPWARHRGLAGGLLRRALRAARELGCESTTLEASAMGEPLYAALGYRPLGRYAFWERRDRGGLVT
ncbi:MAG TPA: GNAT family N-acetyltransferase [Solirubrobacteraceae bacterium]|jgi:ribosomal protein S18 acetylase RimI-like enzyme|nr:GNAT family N-acetyltransferase [Solirubrobacteraceae bacterium]